MRKLLLLLVINFLLFCFCHNTSAQSWKKVVPLVSTCESLKKDFPIKDCNSFSSKLNFPDYDIAIYYSNKSCQNGGQWDVPKGTVTEVFIDLKPIMKLADYDGNLKDYVMKPEDDLPDYKTFTNDMLGIRLTVVEMSETGRDFIQSIFLYPSSENENKFKCGKQVAEKPKCPKKNQ